MGRKFLSVGVMVSLFFSAIAQKSMQPGIWRALLLRQDGNNIVFNLQVQQVNGKTILYVLNAPEKMLVNDVQVVKDSVFINMPLFESSFKAKIVSKDSLNGIWIKGGSQKNQVMAFTASAKQPYRFLQSDGNALKNITGKWQASFAGLNNQSTPALAEFKQDGNKVHGSILTGSGDYRYLEGTVTGNTLLLSTFDGIHALVFSAKISGDELKDGKFYSGASGHTSWTAVKNDQAKLPELSVMNLKDGEDGHLNFSFNDIDGNKVSINDDRFKNKVTIIQLMGSWCPNCMDETAFLSDFYAKNKHRGVEIIALAYELSEDFERSQKSLRKFQQKYNVTYPILVTGTTAMDTLATEKTLPQITDITTYPTSLVLDKSGVVRKIDTGFFGPGTGEFYEQYKKNFEATIESLLTEKTEKL